MAKVTKILHNKQSRAKAKQRQPNDYFFVEVSPHFVLLKVTLIGAKALVVRCYDFTVLRQDSHGC